MTPVLETCPLIDTSQLIWQRATKTKPIKAKQLDKILVDAGVLEKFLLDTLEGHQSLKAGSMVCIGVQNDVWQQTKEKLYAKYIGQNIDNNGWITCVPKPENEVNCTLVEESLCGAEGFSLIGQWGEDHIVEGKKVHLQFGVAGDFICQNQKDPTDVWRVARKFFDSTYNIV